MKILVLGYGNPGRRDDGLGPALADAVEKMALDSVTADSDYQLNIEYALDLKNYDMVIFVDAGLDVDEPFEFRKLEPSKEIAHTTHSMSAESVLGLAHELNESQPIAYLLAIRGYEFDFGEELSDKAKENLGLAMDFLLNFLSEQST